MLQMGSQSASICFKIGLKGLEICKDTRIAGSGAGKIGSSANVLLSDRIFSSYALPFWALSFVLLAAVIGAIVLARKD